MIKQIRKKRLNTNGEYEIIHYETDASMVLMDDGNNVEEKLKDIKNLPVNVKILEVICTNIALSSDNNTYEFSEPITLDENAEYWLEYIYCDEDGPLETYSAFSKPIEDENGSLRVSWFYSYESQYDVLLTSSALVDNWWPSVNKVLNIYKVAINTTDYLLHDAIKHEGYNTTASGYVSHAEGYNTTASGYASHAEGYNTTASGSNSHAEGYNTTASGYASHAEGYNTTASGYASHAEGYNTTASGSNSHAEGYNTTASGSNSHAEGYNTTASGYASHVQGKYNIKDSKLTYAHIVGNGTGNTTRSNAHALDWDGNAWFAGDVYINTNFSSALRWRSCSPNENFNFNLIQYFNGLWVASTNNQKNGLWWSKDGKTWTQSNVTEGDFQKIIYGGGIYIALRARYSKGSSSYWSEDGKIWTQIILEEGFELDRDCIYADGLWIAYAQQSSSSAKAMIFYSNDGKNWTQCTPSDDFGKSLTWANGLFFANKVGYLDFLYYSKDGKTWTKTSEIQGSYGEISYANGIWICSGDYYSSSNSGLWWSENGETWTKSNVTKGEFTKAVYANGVWVVCGGSNYYSRTLYYSEDGKVWISSGVTSSSNSNYIYANDLWVAANSSSVYWSEDGKAWTQITDIAGSYELSFADNLWVIAGNSKNNYSVYSSLDGKTWEKSIFSPSSALYLSQCLKFSGGLWFFSTTATNTPSYWASSNMNGEKLATEDLVATKADKAHTHTLSDLPLSTETWTFTLADGSTVTKQVCVNDQ